METMTSRERVWKTLRHESLDRVPRQLWTLPGVNMFRKDEQDRMNEAFLSDFMLPDVQYGNSGRTRGVPNEVGVYTDEWGCIWHVAEPGVVGEVKEYVINDLSKADEYELPWKLLEGADFTRVDTSCAATDRFVLAGTNTRPFERLQFLRGTENLFMDLATGELEILRLLERLHEFFLREMRM